MKTIVSFVLGGPASGKGLFCDNFVKKFKNTTKHISAGNLLREEIEYCLQNKSKGVSESRYNRSRTIQNIINNGQIVPAMITVELLKENIFLDKSKYYLIDGFPRNYDNLTAWNQEMKTDCEVRHAFF